MRFIIKCRLSDGQLSVGSSFRSGRRCRQRALAEEVTEVAAIDRHVWIFLAEAGPQLTALVTALGSRSRPHNGDGDSHTDIRVARAVRSIGCHQQRSPAVSFTGDAAGNNMFSRQIMGRLL